ncbi:MAG: bifunctional phosphopantothenoylcysteine decarboxylase/phosphopantothenate--cysteine ligase CoaBC [Nitrospirae bacterium]|nr:bifunctional phosphopantothenoylcysteine decarboxylase/phosphopantothenate--cysteine ligase CoaBC [Nitrospirota bacterium]
MLKNRKILLGVTGSIAVYKSVDLVRRLTKEGASVQVIMTDASRKFVTPLSFEVVSQSRVFTDTFQDPLSHISLTSDADLMVIAPATANIVGKFAGGIADDMLSTCFLSFKGKTVIAPAMNWRMYENPVFQKNLGYLASLGVIQVGPEKGSLACGDDAVGRMSDVSDIMEGIRSALTRKDLSGKRIMVTAGPTREYMDPVRFMSNRSSGRMGYAIARAALRRGAEVILISGPSPLKPPSGAGFVAVETTGEMRDAVMKNLKDSDAVIMAAAVSDFSPEDKNDKKIDKSGGLVLKLKKTPDILSEIGFMKKRPFLVGFAAETGADISRARKKLLDKGADVVVFNNVLSPGSGFDVDTNQITIIQKEGESSFPLMSKDEVADLLLDRIAHFIP